MATKIRRCLYVGLGGTGMKTLLKIKKLFVDTYGEVPPMIGFLGVDTDGGQFKDTLKSREGKDIILDPIDQLRLEIHSARQYYNQQAEHFGWIDDRNVAALDGLQNIGAGQIRSNGRFVLKVNATQVKTKVQSLINKISNAQNMHNPKYNILQTDAVEIHMVFSVSGGTGCGTFIDMAYLLKEAAGNCKLTGYGVLPDGYRSEHGLQATPKVKANAMGAIQDLDYLMHLDARKPAIEFDWLTSTTKVNERPFNAFFFVDNKDAQGNVYDKTSHLEDMMALAMVTAAGELSVASASVSDNVEKVINEGDMDVLDKKAWVSSMGVCEILFKGDALQLIYNYKVVKALIDRLRSSSADMDVEANAWIDSPEVNIRENNGKDNVIDFLLDKNVKYPITEINERVNPHPEVEGFLNGSAAPKQDEVDAKVTELSRRVKGELNKLITAHINQEEGVEKTRKLLDILLQQVTVFKNEMNNELKGIESDKLPKAENALNAAESDLSEYNKKLIKISSKNQEYTESVIAAAMNLAKERREKVRRESAVRFYNGIESEIQGELRKVKEIADNLETVYARCSQRIAELQNNAGGKAQTFQIDLTQNWVNAVSVDEACVNTGDFIKNMSFPQKVAEFGSATSESVMNEMLKYANTIEQSAEWAKMGVEDVFKKMDEPAFDRLMQDAAIKSLPLLQFDNHGHMTQTPVGNFYYVGVEDKENSRLAANDNLKNKLGGAANIAFCSIGQKDRAIIYHQVGVVPAFEIMPLPTYGIEYEQCHVFCHFDTQVYSRMMREEYSLLPKDVKDDTLELWVMGFVIGKIKNEDGMYYVHSLKLGDPLQDYWYALDQYRDAAYAKLRSEIKDLGVELQEAIDSYESEKGTQEVQRLLSDVKAPGQYLATYSQLNMSPKELNRKGYEGIRDLMKQEIDFVTKELTI